MNKFIIGQRWISETEPELGLGTITDVEERITSVSFFGSQEERKYATATAPLKRVIFRPGDEIVSRDDIRICIEDIRETSNGLLVYSGNGMEIYEYDICDTVSYSTPKERLINGITDPVKIFNLRYETVNIMAVAKKSPVRGFVGGRVDLIDHQFYIADEVASRHVPKVLLSDEVGLGKTIEAGLILHRLLVCERIRRVLIIVPDSLVHQWFFELWRRFNLLFRIFDEPFCSSAEKQDPGINPFLDFQLGICSNGFFKNSRRKQQALTAGWDMLVVDEAHHIVENSPEYRFIKSLGQTSRGMLLLTATPDQMGERSHFAHLKLLDPARYFDYRAFAEHAANFRKISELIDQVSFSKIENIDTESAHLILGLHQEEEKKRFERLIKGNHDDRGQLVAEILDRHGTGRTIFRNTRAAIHWFPQRVEKLYPLDATPEQVVQTDRELLNELKPERESESYDYTNDPRILFLVNLQKKLKSDKILVICRSMKKSIAIEAAIKKIVNIKIALFNESMSLVQRDRNAAWFSETRGARIMICSEIGSEGRNFQFAHHLVMFDLPLNPELLEQRVGRLDRIGQTRDITIHVPYIKDSAWEILVNWYSSGLEIFENNVNGLYHIYKKFRQRLSDVIKLKIDNDENLESDCSSLMSDTASYRIHLGKEFEQGRNRLLELNSFHAGRARILTENIAAIDKSRDLDNFMLKIFEIYGIRTDEISDRTWRLHFNDLTGSEFPLPALGERKKTVTFDRKMALIREEVDFLTWDHPMVTGAMELLLGSERGNSCIALWIDTGSHGILLEAIFVLECVASPGLYLERFLSPSALRIVVDSSGNDVTENYPFDLFAENLENFTGAWVAENKEVSEILLPAMINAAGDIASSAVQPVIVSTLTEIESVMSYEIQRLKDLQKVNPDISNDEIENMEDEKHTLCSHVQDARYRLDALRIVLMA